MTGPETSLITWAANHWLDGTAATLLVNMIVQRVDRWGGSKDLFAILYASGVDFGYVVFKQLKERKDGSVVAKTDNLDITKDLPLQDTGA